MLNFNGNNIALPNSARKREKKVAKISLSHGLLGYLFK
jgi:hypothetical protein